MWFGGPDHAIRGVAAAAAMQRILADVGGLDTSRGRVRLRMTVGVDSGETDAWLVGSEHRELILCGPLINRLIGLEQAAGPGEVLLGRATAAALDARAARTSATAWDEAAEAHRLRRAPIIEPVGAPLLAVDYRGVPIEQTLCAAVREHVLAGRVDHEHRHVATGFLRVTGVEQCLRQAGPARPGSPRHSTASSVRPNGSPSATE